MVKKIVGFVLLHLRSKFWLYRFWVVRNRSVRIKSANIKPDCVQVKVA